MEPDGLPKRPTKKNCVAPGGGGAAPRKDATTTDADGPGVEKELDAAMGAEAEDKMKDKDRLNHAKPEQWQTASYKKKYGSDAMLKSVSTHF